MEYDVAILNPEKAILTFRLAGMGVRILAHVVDLILMIVMVVLLAWLAVFMTQGFDQGIGLGAASVIGVATTFLYFIVQEALWNGQTFGKKLCGIRVRMTDGTPITLAASVTRNLLRPADMLPGPYFVGLLAIFTNPRAQRIGDLVAGTIVCYETKPQLTTVAAPHTAGIHAMEEHVGSLRGMNINEYVTLRRFADRYPSLPGHVQEKLLLSVWEPFAEKRKVPVVQGVHPIYLIEAVVMKYGREHGML